MEDGHGQAIIISGESGAGKTEATKKCLQYMSEVAGTGGAGIDARLLGANPVLEAFGNAKTVRNDNSSRFGKWMEVQFTPSGALAGCRIINYLLERSRITAVSNTERSYHVFYMLSNSAAQAKFPGLSLPAASAAWQYFAGTEAPPDVADMLEDALAAFSSLSIGATAVQHILAVVSGVAWLGNVRFAAYRAGEFEDGSQVDMADAGSADALHRAAQLLGMEPSALQTELTSRVRTVRSEAVRSALQPAGAAENRDSLVKALYARLFDHLVTEINERLAPSGPAPGVIGVLDIFGFEIFESNSFEQLCINYCNEKLQQHFNEHVFKAEQALYQAEGLSMEHLTFDNNDDVVALLEQKPSGLLPMLDDEIRLPNGSDEHYIERISKMHAQHVRFVRVRAGKAGMKDVRDTVGLDAGMPADLSFAVRHYAGGVVYDAASWCEKSKDAIAVNLTELCASSSAPLVPSLMRERGAAAAATPGRGNRSAVATQGGKFRAQLSDLMKVLEVNAPHYIRCVKPNRSKRPRTWEGSLCLQQLRYSGVFEAVRIRQAGYPFRVTHKQFYRRFHAALDIPEPAIVAGLQDEGMLPTHTTCPLTGKQYLRAPKAAKATAWSDSFYQRVVTAGIASMQQAAKAAGDSASSAALDDVLFGRTLVLHRAAAHWLFTQRRRKTEERAVLDVQRSGRGFLARQRVAIAVAARAALASACLARDLAELEAALSAWHAVAAAAGFAQVREVVRAERVVADLREMAHLRATANVMLQLDPQTEYDRFEAYISAAERLGMLDDEDIVPVHNKFKYIRAAKAAAAKLVAAMAEYDLAGLKAAMQAETDIFSVYGPVFSEEQRVEAEACIATAVAEAEQLEPLFAVLARAHQSDVHSIAAARRRTTVSASRRRATMQPGAGEQLGAALAQVLAPQEAVAIADAAAGPVFGGEAFERALSIADAWDVHALAAAWGTVQQSVGAGNLVTPAGRVVAAVIPHVLDARTALQAAVHASMPSSGEGGAAAVAFAATNGAGGVASGPSLRALARAGVAGMHAFESVAGMFASLDTEQALPLPVSTEVAVWAAVAEACRLLDQAGDALRAGGPAGPVGSVNISAMTTAPLAEPLSAMRKYIAAVGWAGRKLRAATGTLQDEDMEPAARVAPGGPANMVLLPAVPNCLARMLATLEHTSALRTALIRSNWPTVQRLLLGEAGQPAAVDEVAPVAGSEFHRAFDELENQQLLDALRDAMCVTGVQGMIGDVSTGAVEEACAKLDQALAIATGGAKSQDAARLVTIAAQVLRPARLAALLGKWERVVATLQPVQTLLARWQKGGAPDLESVLPGGAAYPGVGTEAARAAWDRCVAACASTLNWPLPAEEGSNGSTATQAAAVPAAVAPEVALLYCHAHAQLWRAQAAAALSYGVVRGTPGQLQYPVAPPHAYAAAADAVSRVLRHCLEDGYAIGLHTGPMQRLAAVLRLASSARISLLQGKLQDAAEVAEAALGDASLGLHTLAAVSGTGSADSSAGQAHADLPTQLPEFHVPADAAGAGAAEYSALMCVATELKLAQTEFARRQAMQRLAAAMREGGLSGSPGFPSGTPITAQLQAAIEHADTVSELLTHTDQLAVAEARLVHALRDSVLQRDWSRAARYIRALDEPASQSPTSTDLAAAVRLLRGVDEASLLCGAELRLARAHVAAWRCLSSFAGAFLTHASVLAGPRASAGSAVPLIEPLLAVLQLGVGSPSLLALTRTALAVKCMRDALGSGILPPAELPDADWPDVQGLLDAGAAGQGPGHHRPGVADHNRSNASWVEDCMPPVWRAACERATRVLSQVQSCMDAGMAVGRQTLLDHANALYDFAPEVARGLAGALAAVQAEAQAVVQRGNEQGAAYLLAAHLLTGAGLAAALATASAVPAQDAGTQLLLQLAKAVHQMRSAASAQNIAQLAMACAALRVSAALRGLHALPAGTAWPGDPSGVSDEIVPASILPSALADAVLGELAAHELTVRRHQALHELAAALMEPCIRGSPGHANVSNAHRAREMLAAAVSTASKADPDDSLYGLLQVAQGLLPVRAAVARDDWDAAIPACTALLATASRYASASMPGLHQTLQEAQLARDEAAYRDMAGSLADALGAHGPQGRPESFDLSRVQAAQLERAVSQATALCAKFGEHSPAATALVNVGNLVAQVRAALCEHALDAVRTLAGSAIAAAVFSGELLANCHAQAPADCYDAAVQALESLLPAVADELRRSQSYASHELALQLVAQALLAGGPGLEAAHRAVQPAPVRAQGLRTALNHQVLRVAGTAAVDAAIDLLEQCCAVRAAVQRRDVASALTALAAAGLPACGDSWRSIPLDAVQAAEHALNTATATAMANSSAVAPMPPPPSPASPSGVDRHPDHVPTGASEAPPDTPPLSQQTVQQVVMQLREKQTPSCLRVELGLHLAWAIDASCTRAIQRLAIKATPAADRGASPSSQAPPAGAEAAGSVGSGSSSPDSEHEPSAPPTALSTTTGLSEVLRAAGKLRPALSVFGLAALDCAAALVRARGAAAADDFQELARMASAYLPAHTLAGVSGTMARWEQAAPELSQELVSTIRAGQRARAAQLLVEALQSQYAAGRPGSLDTTACSASHVRLALQAATEAGLSDEEAGGISQLRQAAQWLLELRTAVLQDGWKAVRELVARASHQCGAVSNSWVDCAQPGSTDPASLWGQHALVRRGVVPIGACNAMRLFTLAAPEAALLRAEALFRATWTQLQRAVTEHRATGEAGEIDLSNCSADVLDDAAFAVSQQFAEQAQLPVPPTLAALHTAAAWLAALRRAALQGAWYVVLLGVLPDDEGQRAALRDSLPERLLRQAGDIPEVPARPAVVPHIAIQEVDLLEACARFEVATAQLSAALQQGQPQLADGSSNALLNWTAADELDLTCVSSSPIHEALALVARTGIASKQVATLQETARRLAAAREAVLRADWRGVLAALHAHSSSQAAGQSALQLAAGPPGVVMEAGAAEARVLWHVAMNRAAAAALWQACALEPARLDDLGQVRVPASAEAGALAATVDQCASLALASTAAQNAAQVARTLMRCRALCSERPTDWDAVEAALQQGARALDGAPAPVLAEVEVYRAALTWSAVHDALLVAVQRGGAHGPAGFIDFGTVVSADCWRAVAAALEAGVEPLKTPDTEAALQAWQQAGDGAEPAKLAAAAAGVPSHAAPRALRELASLVLFVHWARVGCMRGDWDMVSQALRAISACGLDSQLLHSVEPELACLKLEVQCDDVNVRLRTVLRLGVIAGHVGELDLSAVSAHALQPAVQAAQRLAAGLPAVPSTLAALLHAGEGTQRMRDAVLSEHWTDALAAANAQGYGEAPDLQEALASEARLVAAAAQDALLRVEIRDALQRGALRGKPGHLVTEGVAVRELAGLLQRARDATEMSEPTRVAATAAAWTVACREAASQSRARMLEAAAPFRAAAGFGGLPCATAAGLLTDQATAPPSANALVPRADDQLALAALRLSPELRLCAAHAADIELGDLLEAALLQGAVSGRPAAPDLDSVSCSPLNNALHACSVYGTRGPRSAAAAELCRALSGVRRALMTGTVDELVPALHAAHAAAQHGCPPGMHITPLPQIDGLSADESGREDLEPAAEPARGVGEQRLAGLSVRSMQQVNRELQLTAHIAALYAAEQALRTCFEHGAVRGEPGALDVQAASAHPLHRAATLLAAVPKTELPAALVSLLQAVQHMASLREAVLADNWTQAEQAVERLAQLGPDMPAPAQQETLLVLGHLRHLAVMQGPLAAAVREGGPPAGRLGDMQQWHAELATEDLELGLRHADGVGCASPAVDQLVHSAAFLLRARQAAHAQDWPGLAAALDTLPTDALPDVQAEAARLQQELSYLRACTALLSGVSEGSGLSDAGELQAHAVEVRGLQAAVHLAEREGATFLAPLGSQLLATAHVVLAWRRAYLAANVPGMVAALEATRATELHSCASAELSAAVLAFDRAATQAELIRALGSCKVAGAPGQLSFVHADSHPLRAALAFSHRGDSMNQDTARLVQAAEILAIVREQLGRPQPELPELEQALHLLRQLQAVPSAAQAELTLVQYDLHCAVVRGRLVAAVREGHGVVHGMMPRASPATPVTSATDDSIARAERTVDLAEVRTEGLATAVHAGRELVQPPRQLAVMLAAAASILAVRQALLRHAWAEAFTRVIEACQMADPAHVPDSWAQQCRHIHAALEVLQQRQDALRTLQAATESGDTEWLSEALVQAQALRLPDCPEPAVAAALAAAQRARTSFNAVRGELVHAMQTKSLDAVRAAMQEATAAGYKGHEVQTAQLQLDEAQHIADQLQAAVSRADIAAVRAWLARATAAGVYAPAAADAHDLLAMSPHAQARMQLGAAVAAGDIEAVVDATLAIKADFFKREARTWRLADAPVLAPLHELAAAVGAHGSALAPRAGVLLAWTARPLTGSLTQLNAAAQAAAVLMSQSILAWTGESTQSGAAAAAPGLVADALAAANDSEELAAEWVVQCLRANTRRASIHSAAATRDAAALRAAALLHATLQCVAVPAVLENFVEAFLRNDLAVWGASLRAMHRVAFVGSPSRAPSARDVQQLAASWAVPVPAPAPAPQPVSPGASPGSTWRSGRHSTEPTKSLYPDSCVPGTLRRSGTTSSSGDVSRGTVSKAAQHSPTKPLRSHTVKPSAGPAIVPSHPRRGVSGTFHATAIGSAAARAARGAGSRRQSSALRSFK